MKRAAQFLNPRKNSRRKSINPDPEPQRVYTEILLEQMDFERPKYRSQCPVERPCPYVGCRYNLYLDITDTGNIKFNFFGIEPWEMRASCALDIGNQYSDGLSLTDIGEYMGLTRERVRQIEREALNKLKDTLGEEFIRDLLNETIRTTQHPADYLGDQVRSKGSNFGG